MKRIGGLLLCSMLVVGCSRGRMAVAPDIASASEEVPVTERSAWSGALADESMTIGRYRVTAVDRKWTTRAGWSVLGFGASTSTGGYAFVFEGPSGQARGECVTEVDGQKASAFAVTIGKRLSRLACRCSGAGSDAQLLVEAAGTDSGLAGRAEPRGAKWTVEAVSRLEGGASMGSPVGYQLRDGSGPIGAVETINPGRVWLGRGLSDAAKADAMCMSAGLLLYMPDRH